MRKVKRWTLLLCALFLTAAGAVMPQAVSAVQDAHMENLRESRTLDAVSLTLVQNEDVQQVLHLMSGSYIKADWEGAAQLTAEQAAGKAVELLEVVVELGLLRHQPEKILKYGEIHAEPYIFIFDEESNRSALVWECQGDILPGGSILIDDGSGLMVSMYLYAGWREDTSACYDSVEEVDLTLLLEKAQEWTRFLSAYYGVEMDIWDVVEAYDKYAMEFVLVFNRGTERGQCRLVLDFWDRFVNLNS